MVIISPKTKNSSAGAVFFVLLAAAAVSAVVALAVFGPVAHDRGAVEPSHGGLGVAMVQCKLDARCTGGCSRLENALWGNTTWIVVVGKGNAVAAEDRT
jgi:hypothetical protein